MTLTRRTPLPRKRSKPRRVAGVTCSRRGCTGPPRFWGWCAKHARKVADRLYAKYVVRRDGKCQVCGTDTDLQCAHIVSRRYFAKRWTEDGAVALCIYDHKLYTENPLAWDRWCRERFGEEKWERFKFQAEAGGMPDLGYTIDLMRNGLLQLGIPQSQIDEWEAKAV